MAGFAGLGLKGSWALGVDDTVVESLPSNPMAHPRDPDLPPAAGDLLGGDVLGRSLERWTAAAAVDEAARARIRARWLRIQAEEDASLAGALVDLTERGRPVMIEVRDRRVRGRVVGVGGDFVAVRSDQDQQVLLPMQAIDVIHAEPGDTDARGDRPPLYETTLHAVLGPVAADRPHVAVMTYGGSTVRGQLRSAGRDVLRIRLDADPPSPTWVPLHAVAMLVLEP